MGWSSCKAKPMIETSEFMKTRMVVHELPDEPTMDSKAVHIWFCDLDRYGISKITYSALSASELERVKRLKSLDNRRRLVSRFTFVRNVLGNIVEIDPAVLEFCQSYRGKPQLAYPANANKEEPRKLDFSISHTENILALAVVFGGTVGIDIEVVRNDLDFFDIAMTHFTIENLELLRSMPSNTAAITFYKLWTRREAFAKMDGSGIVWQSDTKSMTNLDLALYPFQFKMDNKEIVGALARNSEICHHVNSDDVCLAHSISVL